MTPRPTYPSYKPSGVDWLGDIPSHWEARRIKHVFDERNEKGHAAEPLLAATQNHGVVEKDRFETRTVIAENDLHTLKLVLPDDFVISLRSFQGGIEMAHDRGIISPAYTIFRSRPDVHVGFLRILLKSFRFIQLLQRHVTGIRQGQNIDYVKLGRAHIPLPPLDEQRAIADYLDRKDEQITRFIAARRRMIALLEEKKQAIINQAVTRGLDPTVPMKDSGVEWLGQIPAHWEVRRLKSLGRLANGSTPERGNSDYWNQGTVPWLNSGSVNQIEVEVADQFVTHRAMVECHLPDLVPDDLLIAITGQGKTRGTAAISHITGTINQHLARLRIQQRLLQPEFGLRVLQSAYTALRELSDGSGGTRGALTLADLSGFAVAVPPLQEQEEVVQRLRKTESQHVRRLGHYQREIELMQEYRTRLISDVVTGKVRIAW